MGRMAISLWEEAAPLERNRTGCEGGGALVASLKLALQVQVRHKKQTKNPSTTLCASRASIVVNLISTSMKKLFGRTVGIILQPLAHSRTLKLGR